LDSWYIRNEGEHEMENNPIVRSKEKIVEEIRWTMSKYKENIPKVYLDMTEEELIALPKDNLSIMAVQMKRFKKTPS
jgi:hypothetical protein